MHNLNVSDQAVLAYLVLILLVVVGSMVISSRGFLNKTLQQAAIWGLIFVGIVGAYSLRDRIEASLYPERALISERGTVSFTRALDGHFYAELTVNNKKVEFVIDTGASDIVLSQNDAKNLGFKVGDLVYSGRASTANGVVPMARITLDRLVLGRFTDRKITAMVNGGDLDTSLLGMRYLERFRKIEIAGSRLTLTR